MHDQKSPRHCSGKTYLWNEDRTNLSEAVTRYGHFDGNLLIDDPDQVAAVRDWATRTHSNPLLLLNRSPDWKIAVSQLTKPPKRVTIAHAVASDMQSLEAIYENEEGSGTGISQDFLKREPVI